MNSIHDAAPTGDFDLLTPELVLKAVEGAFGLSWTGNITQYNSYINRVYELHEDDGQRYMAKFYRPGRWSEEAILEEHTFIQDCVDLEIPTVAPLPDPGGDTLPVVEVVDPARVESGTTGTSTTAPEHAKLQEYHFALFPKRGGRNFDAESEEDWLRLGALVGRMHTAALQRGADRRQYCLPSPIINQCLLELDEGNAVHPEHRKEFFELAAEILRRIKPLFEGVTLQRVHGDCHRGNILERPGEGLLLIDFDDMMIGPAVQDLWLLLPDHADACTRELTMLEDGYSQFRALDHREFELIEPLRFMRMVHFLAWRGRQRHDHWFRQQFPEWGNHAFWVREMEDL